MAVKDINMLPYDVLEKSVQMRRCRFWARWLVLALVLGVALVLGSRQWIRLQGGSLPATARLQEDVARKLGRIEAVNGEIEALSEKEKTLSRIVPAPACYEVLAVFAGCFDDGSRIESLSLQRGREGAGNILLNCQGVCLDYRGLGMFLERVSKIPGIQKTTLSQAGVGATDALVGAGFAAAVRFSLSCQLMEDAAP